MPGKIAEDVLHGRRIGRSQRHRCLEAVVFLMHLLVEPLGVEQAMHGVEDNLPGEQVEAQLTENSKETRERCVH